MVINWHQFVNRFRLCRMPLVWQSGLRWKCCQGGNHDHQTDPNIHQDLYRWWFETKCSGGRMNPVGRSWGAVVADKRYRRPWLIALGGLIFNLEKYSGIRARNIHLIWLTSICRWLNKYLDIYDKWYHRKWDGTGSKKSREKYGKLCSSEQKPEILSQIIYCTNIFGPYKACNAVPIITNNMNFNQPWITQEPGPLEIEYARARQNILPPDIFCPRSCAKRSINRISYIFIFHRVWLEQPSAGSAAAGVNLLSFSFNVSTTCATSMVWVLSMRIDMDASRSVTSTNTKFQSYRGVITLQSVKGVLVDSVVAC